MVEIVIGGLFSAGVLFLVSAGLQVVFGVQRVLNLACGAFFAFGAYGAISAVGVALEFGLPQAALLPVLLAAGVLFAFAGLPVEWLLRPVYRRDESSQLLITFGVLLILQDVIRAIWGTTPKTLENVHLVYGRVEILGTGIPVYTVLVIAASIFLAIAVGMFLQRTRLGRIVRATAENARMSGGLGVDTSRIYTLMFCLGTMLGTIGGALVAPVTAASLGMADDGLIEAFAVVVIGGLGSMFGALVGALIVGMIRAVAISYAPEFEILAIYLVVIAVLAVRPAGLFGKTYA